MTLKNKMLASVTAIILFTMSVVYFLIYPTIIDIKKIGSDIDSQRLDLEKKYIRGQSLNRLSRDLKNIEPSLAVLDDVFIDQNRALEFITSLEEVAGKNGITQKINLMSDDSTKEFDYKKTPIEIVASGQFPDVVRYIAGIENLNYYVNIENIDITSGSADKNTSDGKQVSVQIKANTFWK